jgi:hypothetical protein
MNPILPLAFASLICCISPIHAEDTETLHRLFASDHAKSRTVTIPPGDYHLEGVTPIPLPSHCTVLAYGARFHFPERLGNRHHRVLFAAENLTDFRWFGGHFSGHVFDPQNTVPLWEPNANTRAIVVRTTAGGVTGNLSFRDVSSENLAGAAITVLGAEKKGDEREVETFARNVSLENCVLERTGKFMWDYGYLWQITVWPEDYSEAEREMAAKYFRHDLIRGALRMESGNDRIVFANTAPLPLSAETSTGLPERATDTVCFFGDALPRNVVRGRAYFVVSSHPEWIRISETRGGEALKFDGSAGPNVRLMHNLFGAHLALYAPTGSGPGKGAMDLVGCEGVLVRGCRLSALGDTMHIQKSRDIVFSGNQITGSRMGAFFLAEYCQNAVITGNTVDGTNGSRVISVEKSCEDVVITGNTFRNGGRGSWINQPRNFVLADNLFISNTTKCEPDPRRGRRTVVTGDYERYAELYFTTHEPNGRYGSVVVRGNMFQSGDHASDAITFAPGGDSILVCDNLFQGKVRTLAPPDGCTGIEIRNNTGLVQPAQSVMKSEKMPTLR